MIPKASVGRIVIVNGNAAIIVKVWSDTCVNVNVFNAEGGNSFVSSASYGTDVNQWSWPERV